MENHIQDIFYAIGTLAIIGITIHFLAKWCAEEWNKSRKQR